MHPDASPPRKPIGKTPAAADLSLPKIFKDQYFDEMSARGFHVMLAG